MWHEKKNLTVIPPTEIHSPHVQHPFMPDDNDSKNVLIYFHGGIGSRAQTITATARYYIGGARISTPLYIRGNSTCCPLKYEASGCLLLVTI